MFKKSLIFGLLGFFVSLIIISVTSPKSNISIQETGSFSYKDGLNGWISFGNILEESFKEAFLNKDDIFVSMFMWKIMSPIKIPNEPKIIIAEEDNSIFWTDGDEQKGTKYTAWKEDEKDENVLIADSISIVRIPIISDNRRIAGYLFLEIKNKPNPKDFATAGWQYYGTVLASSGTIRGNVANRNRSEIKSYFDKVTKKEDIINLTILDRDEIVLWDTDDSRINKKLENGGWINQEKDKKQSDRFYFSSPVEQQESKIADIHYLVKLPSPEGVSFIKGIINKFEGLLNAKSLIFSIIAFLVFFSAGIVLSKGAGSGIKVIKKAGASKSTPGLENKVQQLEEEIQELEQTKAEVTELVANQQKIQKDLEKEIESLQKEKEIIPKEAPAGMGPLAGGEESEEALLFENLLGEKGKTSAEKKQELELTQRIVAKRREEIELSSKIETRRRELLELEQKIEKLKGK